MRSVLHRASVDLVQLHRDHDKGEGDVRRSMDIRAARAAAAQASHRRAHLDQPKEQDHLLAPDGSASQLWAGDQVWQGFELGQTMRGSTYWSCHDRAQWEKFMHNFLIEQGFGPVAIIGDPEYLDLWKVGM